MRLDQLHPAPGAKKGPKRVGRGPGSGHGKTAGKGHKGQKARAGGGKGAGFEGGQMPLFRRVPKRGFTPRERRAYAVVNLSALEPFPAGSVVDPDRLVEAGLIKKSERGAVKLLGDGELARVLTVKVHAVSASAKQKVEAAGGVVEVLPA
ncbi:MAG: 50S ribosomal protein L15 [Candidatus Rokubacteria bacterium]|nr:50S ribosomal protein L15 [Candidatus Rokubacteria bacterium]MBI2544775.1 50S ribosomal protein L15 [Candidatus Rokubacteria bacterium]MBI2555308.1 50S ribosomal protein L15 [Candidatus Rokubacteria bacterium]